MTEDESFKAIFELFTNISKNIERIAAASEQLAVAMEQSNSLSSDQMSRLQKILEENTQLMRMRQTQGNA